MHNLPTPNFTAERAFYIGEALAPLLPERTGESLAYAIELARRHPLADVLDAYCDGIARLTAAPVIERPGIVDRIIDDMRFAAAVWP